MYHFVELNKSQTPGFFLDNDYRIDLCLLGYTQRQVDVESEAEIKKKGYSKH